MLYSFEVLHGPLDMRHTDRDAETLPRLQLKHRLESGAWHGMPKHQRPTQSYASLYPTTLAQVRWALGLISAWHVSEEKKGLEDAVPVFSA